MVVFVYMLPTINAVVDHHDSTMCIRSEVCTMYITIPFSQNSEYFTYHLTFSLIFKFCVYSSTFSVYTTGGDEQDSGIQNVNTGLPSIKRRNSY